MAAVDEEKLKAIFKRDGLEKVELDLAGGKYFNRRKTFMRALVDLEKRRIADDRYEKSTKTPWRKTTIGIIVISVFVGLCVAYLSYRFGWLSAPTR